MNTINTILKRGLVALLAIFVSVGTVHAQEIMTHSHGIFFSEYIEGGGNNKAFEIFNSTDDDIDLGNYIVLGNYNGNPFNDTLRFPVGTQIHESWFHESWIQESWIQEAWIQESWIQVSWI